MRVQWPWKKGAGPHVERETRERASFSNRSRVFQSPMERRERALTATSSPDPTPPVGDSTDASKVSQVEPEPVGGFAVL